MRNVEIVSLKDKMFRMRLSKLHILFWKHYLSSTIVCLGIIWSCPTRPFFLVNNSILQGQFSTEECGVFKCWYSHLHWLVSAYEGERARTCWRNYLFHNLTVFVNWLILLHNMYNSCLYLERPHENMFSLQFAV